MDRSCVLSSSCCYNSLNPQFFNLNSYRSSSSSTSRWRFVPKLLSTSNLWANKSRVKALAVDEALEKSKTSVVPSSKEMLPKIDKSGRFCSPRAARELALSIVYASCLEGSDPVRLFEKRMNVRREPGYEFDRDSLLKYNPMSFGGPPVSVNTVEEAEELLRIDEKESAIELEVLSAPPKLVYSKLILRFTRKLLVAIADGWDSHVLVINKVAPSNWKTSQWREPRALGEPFFLEKQNKEPNMPIIYLPFIIGMLQNQPGGKILELCILHLAMSEIKVLGTRHQIVINEAVDLAKRFCDGAAPRIINGCLRTFVKDLEGSVVAQAPEVKQKVVT